MASTVVQICNLALSRIGVKDTISSLSEDTEEAEQCNVLYEPVRDSLLASVEWPFATKHQALALVEETERADWAYMYALPADCLSPRHIWSGERNPSEENKIPFVIELNDAGSAKVILTNEEDAELFYTVAIANTLLFPPLFVDCLAWSLASELAMPLAVRPDLRVHAQQQALLYQQRATAHALSESHDQAPTTPTIAARE